MAMGSGKSRDFGFGARRSGPVSESARISRRGLLLLSSQLVVAGALGWRMRQLQVEQADHFRLLAEENRINMRLIAPARAEIFDRQGRPLAINQQNYRVVMIREQTDAPEEALDQLGRLIEISPRQRERILQKMARTSSFVPILVAEHLSWDDFARINVNAPALPGVLPEVGLSRQYPSGKETAHVVGYVGRVTQKELEDEENRDPILKVPEFQIGKRGIERGAELDLRGAAGTRRIEVNAVGRVIRELDNQSGQTGTDMHLTLDLDLQTHALNRLGGESAAAVVMDVMTGDLLVLASAPSFNPNLFVRGISETDYSALLNDDHRPLHTKWASGMYPPGSTFKMIVALAALEAGLVRPGESVFCNGGYQLGNRRFHCWRRGGHGHVALRASLAESCDVYYYEIAKRVGIARIREMSLRLGLGVEAPLPLPEMRSGLIPSKEWKLRNRDEPWTVGDTLNSGIGQGFVLATPLQLAVMTARIATGTAVEPRLLRARNGVPIPVEPPADLGIAPEHLQRVQDGMHAVVNGGRGTARRWRIAEAVNAMAGKTGTSQVRNITAAERAQGVFRNEDLPWNRRDHALFVGYAPYEAPRYAVSVIVEHGGSGSAAAAPIARDLMMRVLYGPSPPSAAYPRGMVPARPAPETEAPVAEPARIRT